MRALTAALPAAVILSCSALGQTTFSAVNDFPPVNAMVNPSGARSYYQVTNISASPTLLTPGPTSYNGEFYDFVGATAAPYGAILRNDTGAPIANDTALCCAGVIWPNDQLTLVSFPNNGVVSSPLSTFVRWTASTAGTWTVTGAVKISLISADLGFQPPISWGIQR